MHVGWPVCRRTFGATLRLVGCGASLSFCLIGPRAAARAAQNVPTPVAAVGVIADPGVRPVVNEADYRAYRRAGMAMLTAHVSVADQNGGDQECAGQSVYVYPNTAYTRWLIATYGRMIDGGSLSEGMLFPGDWATGLNVPEYLHPYGNDATSALHYGHCNAQNDIVIRDLPLGSYIVVTFVQAASAADAHRSTQVLVQTPDGVHPEERDVGANVARHLGDGYLLATRLTVKIDAPASYSIVEGNLRPVAHFSP